MPRHTSRRKHTSSIAVSKAGHDLLPPMLAQRGASATISQMASAGHVWFKSSSAALPRRISQKCS